MDENLRKVYECMKQQPRWPKEITGESLRAAFKGTGHSSHNGANYWADNRGIDVGDIYEPKKHYTWSRTAKLFREAEGDRVQEGNHK